MKKIPIFLVLGSCVIGLTIYGCSKKSEDPSPNQQSSQTSKGEQLYRGIYYSEGDAGKKIQDVNVHYVDLSDFYRTDEERKNADLVKDSLIQSIKTISPSFFNDFGDKIQSGDPILIQEALNTADSLNYLIAVPKMKAMHDKNLLLSNVEINQFIDKNNKIDRVGLEDYIAGKQLSQAGPNSRGTCLAAAIYVIYLYNYAVAINYFLAVNVGGGINYATAVNFQSSITSYNGNRVIAGLSEDGVCGGGESRVSAEGSLKQDIFIGAIAEKFKK